MSAMRTIALFLALCLAASSAVALPSPAGRPEGTGPSVTLVQQRDLPDIVVLLAQRARRAERRGDLATARELYDAIRDLGYVVQRRPVPSGNQGGDENRPDDARRGGGEGRDGDDARGGDDDDDDDGDGDDDDGDDDDDDDDDDGDDGDDDD